MILVNNVDEHNIKTYLVQCEIMVTDLDDMKFLQSKWSVNKS